ncbi:glycosyltransferase family 39 protein [Zychaea mexicana]|uniref:glycosyltransferase family 39 protein n=1 Tax=Zychaea mexicana TaxID=64656 RepID=UPI0022FEA5BA|nr:glycosyltransferase family 39 protein [Zychaea mexicana]KAI9492835.1 glycosyltransferase family 39 protein [Zychaea mexicana]
MLRNRHDHQQKPKNLQHGGGLSSVDQYHQSNTIHDDADLKKNKRSFGVSSRTACHIVITVVGFFISFFKIWYPAEVVFDEVHFGKFAGYYLNRTFYFDVHPPLGKMMFAAMGYLIGYRGHYDFAEIGESYVEHNVPYIGLRALPASLNVWSIALMYAIMKQSGYSTLACVVASGMYLFDNALVAQHRLILLDSSLVFYMLLTIYTYIRFYKLRHRSFSFGWWSWLVASGASMAMVLSVKMVGLFTVGSVGVAVAADLWSLLDIRNGLSLKEFGAHFLARTVGFIIVPTAVYLFWFYVHFAVLNQSGPGDVYMSPSFQATLENSPVSLKTLDVHYYDSITIFHPTTSVYLHSHEHRYPRRYEDGRVGSAGQQVVGVSDPDENSYWRVKPTKDIPKDSRVLVRHGDIIQLEHTASGQHLLTHDVASPLTRTNQEFTVVPPEERYNETLFKVLLDDHANGDTMKTQMKSFKLAHQSTTVAMWTFKEETLPLEWGFGLQEINGKKDHVKEKTAYWRAMDIQGVNATDINLKKKKEHREKPMPFWKKFLELQIRTINHNAGLNTPHPYKSRPLSWPLMRRGISYWRNELTREQIYMTGNVFGWLLGLITILCFGVVAAMQTLARQRDTHAVQNPATRQRVFRSTGFFGILWTFHYIPFFFMGRSLYLHHYLPAAACSYLLIGSLFQFACINGINSPTSPTRTSQAAGNQQQQSFTSMVARPSYWSYLIGITILSVQFAIFVYLAPLTYGSPGLSKEQANQRKLIKSWDLAFA